MKTFVLALATAALAFSGCAATSGKAAAPVPAPTAKPLTGNYAFPSRVSDDGLRDAVADYEQLISRSYDGAVEAELNVCVKPSGQVEKATLVSSSGIAGFDRAVTRAASSWRYAPRTSAESNSRCKTVSVVYQSQI